jgi:acetoin utilization deacetylase AcuC-like enzyme
VPLAAGSDGRALRKAVSEVWLPALQDFAPELVLFSAGFDAHVEDDMAMLRFVDADYAWVTSQVKQATLSSTKGRIVSMLEGGYSLPALGRSAAQHLRVLAGISG